MDAFEMCYVSNTCSKMLGDLNISVEQYCSMLMNTDAQMVSRKNIMYYK